MDTASKLVVLCDGMWCSAETESETNLRMLARLMGIDFEKREDFLHGKRRNVRYFPGPGLGNPFDLIVRGNLGDDIATRCIDIYEYIANNFTGGDELWMFGAGRGAYVIRCVARMIDRCGIVKVKHGAIHETRVLARGAYTMSASPADDLPSIFQFKTSCSWEVTRPIKFIGLFDTTGPKGFSHLRSAVESIRPLRLPAHDVNLGLVAEHVYHAVAIHERLPFFNLEKQAYASPNVHEKWFPGMHYDVARQEFSFHRGSVIANMPLFSWLLGQRVRPNAVISDLVLRWMLEKIQAVDSSMSVVPDLSCHMHELLRGLTSSTRPAGSGDIYGSILEYTPLAPLCVWWNSLPGFLTQPLAAAQRRGLEFVLGLGDRKIPHVGAETYDYKRPFDQSGDTIERLAHVSRERYPSNAYDDFQLIRCLTGETDQATFLCLIGKEHDLRQQPSGDLCRHMVVDINWQGPEFYKLYQGNRDKVDWDRVLTITKASAAGEYYIARSVSAFLSEFYGDLGISLLEWVGRLCTFKTREIPKEKAEEGSPSASAGPSPDTLDRVHLHVSEDSIMACFEDGSLDWKIPATSADSIDRALSALRWVVSVFQILEGTSGIFRVGCHQVDTCDSSSSWLPSREPFEVGKKESSCWTQLFDSAYIAEMPPSLHFDVGERPEGLEIRWDQLLELTKVSRSWYTENGVVLFGADTALVQLVPVETRRWHVVRRPGELISPLDVEKAITSSNHPEALRREFEFWGSLGATNNSTGRKEGAIESWVKRGDENQEREPDQEDFSYPKGTMVYVGWCSEPMVTLGTTAPSRKFLDGFDRQTGVHEVTSRIIALASVNNVTVWNLAVTLRVMGVGLTGGVAHQHGEEKAVQPLATDLPSKGLFCAQLQSIERTPCILWDDTLKRAWLVPGTCALLFVSLCYFARLGLTFNGEIHYAVPSNDAAASAAKCIERNAALRLTNKREPSGITFGHLLLRQWEDMLEAQRVCRSKTNNRKHVRPGGVFGYDINDLLGSGHVGLRYLDADRAGASLRAWEPLARLEPAQVIFCKTIGPVIQCVSENCPGAPCQEFCESAGGPQGVLACLLQDFKRFFEQDWDQYAQSGTLLVRDGFEWVPRGPDPFGHTHRPPHVPGSPCQCCAQLKRLQAITPVNTREFFLKRLARKWVEGGGRFTNAMFLDKPLAVRFGLRT